jgi:hypothetical protein
MLSFCLQSLLREYGWQFVRRVIVPHPVRTVKALLRSRRLDISNDLIATCDEEPARHIGGPRCVVGVGFCLKPMDPPCPSGRFNHDCLYLERLADSAPQRVPDNCKQCAIREIGLMAREAGCAFYIMTSAKDILLDVFVPAQKQRRFSSGLFALCRYSLQPFAVGLMASGMRGWMLPFATGDCADYRTWLLADRGTKNERTSLSDRNRERVAGLLQLAKRGTVSPTGFCREGNVLFSTTDRHT